MLRGVEGECGGVISTLDHVNRRVFDRRLLGQRPTSSIDSEPATNASGDNTCPPCAGIASHAILANGRGSVRPDSGGHDNVKACIGEGRRAAGRGADEACFDNDHLYTLSRNDFARVIARLSFLKRIVTRQKRRSAMRWAMVVGKTSRVWSDWM